ncbi:MAG: hypothetical protein ACFFG0_11465 [Candidatus Thorarchaeota archaeon]
MSDTYIQNCINLIKQKMDTFNAHDQKVSRKWLEIFALEQERRKGLTNDLLAADSLHAEEEADFHLNEDYKL